MGYLGFERSVWISSSFIPWGLCMDLYCFQAVFIHMTPRLLEALYGISSSFIPCEYVRIGTVLKQFPYIGHLGSWEQCVRFNFMESFTPWELCMGLCCLQAVTP